ncbi:MAG: hypothetical protein ACTSRG_10215 [Candidatus Helarchaeota archaeon]
MRIGLELTFVGLEHRMYRFGGVQNKDKDKLVQNLFFKPKFLNLRFKTITALYLLFFWSWQW